MLSIYRQQQAGDQPPRVTGFSRGLMRLANCLVELNQLEEAESLAREAVELLTDAMPGNWRLAEARTALGEVLLARGDVAAAGPLLRGGWQQLDQQRAELKPTERQPILREALRRLMLFYQKTEQADQMQRWQPELDRLAAPTATSVPPEMPAPIPEAQP